MMITIPKDVQFIIDTFYRNGYEAFMVGGCVRDSLLNNIPNDYDITTSASPEVTIQLFNKTIPTGLKHGTVTVIVNNISYEVTTYRTDGIYVDNRRPDSVHFVTDIRDDLSRRDFTINSLAYNNTKNLIDYFNGSTDLKNKLIRTVGDPDKRYNEDALRMLRAIRFSSQLGFSIDTPTYTSIIKNSNLIKNISTERICSELIKIILSPNFNQGFIMLKDTNILTITMPNLNYIDNPNIDALPKDLSTRLAYLFINSDVDYVCDLLKKLKFDNKTITKTVNLLRCYPMIVPCTSNIECKKLLQCITKDNIFNLLSLYEIYNSTTLSTIRSIINNLITINAPLYIKDLNINGTILKNSFSITSGKLIGEILNHLLNLVIEEKLENELPYLLDETKRYLN